MLLIEPVTEECCDNCCREADTRISVDGESRMKLCCSCARVLRDDLSEEEDDD